MEVGHPLDSDTGHTRKWVAEAAALCHRTAIE